MMRRRIPHKLWDALAANARFLDLNNTMQFVRILVKWAQRTGLARKHILLGMRYMVWYAGAVKLSARAVKMSPDILDVVEDLGSTAPEVPMGGSTCACILQACWDAWCAEKPDMVAALGMVDR